jgi:hypothetical protein
MRAAWFLTQSSSIRASTPLRPSAVQSAMGHPCAAVEKGQPPGGGVLVVFWWVCWVVCVYVKKGDEGGMYVCEGVCEEGGRREIYLERERRGGYICI